MRDDIIIFCMPIPLIAFVIYMTIIDRCPKGGFHKWETEELDYVKGNDIGFGITNGYTNTKTTCKKCGESFKSFH